MEGNWQFSKSKSHITCTNELIMDYSTDQLKNKARFIRPDEGEHLAFGNSSVRLKLTSQDTNDQLGIYQIKLEVGAVGAQLHYHRFMDEVFIVNQGIVSIQTGEQFSEALPGTIVYIPRFTPHAFRNNHDEEAIITLIFTPAEQREGFFRGLHQILNTEPLDSEAFLRLYNKYDSFPVEVEENEQRQL